MLNKANEWALKLHESKWVPGLCFMWNIKQFILAQKLRSNECWRSRLYTWRWRKGKEKRERASVRQTRSQQWVKWQVKSTYSDKTCEWKHWGFISCQFMSRECLWMNLRLKVIRFHDNLWLSTQKSKLYWTLRNHCRSIHCCSWITSCYCRVTKKSLRKSIH